MDAIEFRKFLDSGKTDCERILALLDTKYVRENENEKIFLEKLLKSLINEFPTLTDLAIQNALLKESLTDDEMKFLDHMIKNRMLKFNKLNFKTLYMLFNSAYKNDIDYPRWFFGDICCTECEEEAVAVTGEDPEWCWYCTKWYMNLEKDELRYLYRYDESDDDSDDPEALAAEAMGFKKFRVIDIDGYSTDEYLEDTPDIDN